jgi:predicted nucleic acid-binding protein
MSQRQEKKRKYLIDTSALYPLLISGNPFNVDECVISELTPYEVGNVLWRENKQGKLKNPQKVATIFSEAMAPLKKIKLDSIAETLAIAIMRNLTFYDASYAYIAESQNLKLVTQDADLLKKCKQAIPIERME